MKNHIERNISWRKVHKKGKRLKLAFEADLWYNKLINKWFAPASVSALRRRDERKLSSSVWILYLKMSLKDNVQNASDGFKFSVFCKVTKYKDGLNTWCKECKLEQQRKNRTSEIYRKHNLRHNYGITIQQYERMLVEQDGVCAACGMPETHISNHSGKVRLLSVDHDHKTGEVRALLCSACNVALGRLNEDPSRIRALADYAEWCKTHTPPTKIVQLSLLD